ncbi:CDP-diacylglycerol--serine O-phosphatidyltransferase [Reichenbachiella versicolor]|uniref:CDP-diacylglycerol--serine O-phosphatidyltransferase n=1 Tax=Reichenbachiella versicolor TaxID=1821036 RepID=UPI0013A52D0D|nr:CDP-diacylglycerol--serine O-phosphatidyltransferase [Reichenbachiella versicolor]
MNIKKHIPNFLTCCNIFFGCLAVIEVFQGSLSNVIFFTMLSAIADFLDGFAARLLKSYSEIGKDLDSLADMLSFGLVPSLVVFKMVQNLGVSEWWWSYTPLIIAILSGVRLAKFNNDERQSDTFYGLPTPANAMFFCSLPLLIAHEVFGEIVNNPIILVIMSVSMALLLVSEIKMIALKFKGYGWQGNQNKYVTILISIGLLVTFKWIALPLIIVLYVIISILASLFDSNK